jgi:cysteinyl-tRNA synthetase
MSKSYTSEDYMLARLESSAHGTVTVHHTTYRKDCADAAKMIRSLLSERDALRVEKTTLLSRVLIAEARQEHEVEKQVTALTTARREAAEAMRQRAARRCRAYLKNTDILLSNPPQSSGVWQAYNAILAIPLPGEEQ